MISKLIFCLPYNRRRVEIHFHLKRQKLQTIFARRLIPSYSFSYMSLTISSFRLFCFVLTFVITAVKIATMKYQYIHSNIQKYNLHWIAVNGSDWHWIAVKSSRRQYFCIESSNLVLLSPLDRLDDHYETRSHGSQTRSFGGWKANMESQQAAKLLHGLSLMTWMA